MSESVSPYSVEEGDVSRDRDALIGLWRGNLAGGGNSAAKFEWFYANNPAGEPRVLLLREQTTTAVVGAVSAGPRVLQVDARDSRAAVVVDFVVDSRHRTLYPALILQRGMRNMAVQTFELAYGFPNPRAWPLMERAGYRKLGSMVRYVRVVRVAHYAKQALLRLLLTPAGAVIDRVRMALQGARARLPQAWSIAWLSCFDERFDEMWARLTDAPAIIERRDARFLDWRFLRQPNAQYRIFAMLDQDRRLAAYAVCQREGSVLHVRDFLSRGICDPGLSCLLQQVAHAARAEGCSSVSLELLGTPEVQRILKEGGWVPRGSRPVMFASNADGIGDKAWYLTCADEDL
jgi:hypothetical protein